MQINQIKQQIAQAQLKQKLKQSQLRILLALIVLTGISLVASQLTKAQDQPPQETAQPVVEVEVLDLNTNQASLEVTGVVEDAASLTLVAQTAGPITQIYKSEGDYVNAGSWISHQSTGYNTGNAAAIQANIAQKNYNQAKLSLENTVETVAKNRAQADLNRDNTEQMRQIQDNTLRDTEAILDLITDQIDQLEAQIEATTDPSLKQSLQGQLISLKANYTQTKTGYDQARYNADVSKPPTQLADTQKELIFLQTELQLKSAEISKEVARLNLQLAQTQAALARVSAPISGTINRIYVNQGEYVNPGTPIAQISGKPEYFVAFNVAADLAMRIDQNQPIRISLNGQDYSTRIKHVSLSPTNGSLYQVLVDLPPAAETQTQVGAEVTAQLQLQPQIQVNQTSQLVPLSSVYITSNTSYVLLANNNQAQRQTVITGQIVGDQIEITSGLDINLPLILTRGVIENQAIQIKAE